jgi:hypothetical protein
MPDLPADKLPATAPSSIETSSDEAIAKLKEGTGVEVDLDSEETWDLKIVFNAKDLSKSKNTMCATEGCNLAACSAWVSSHDPTEPWFGCLDCQTRDFGGWPEGEELPIKFMSEASRKLILEKCTENAKVRCVFLCLTFCDRLSHHLISNPLFCVYLSSNT